MLPARAQAARQGGRKVAATARTTKQQPFRARSSASYYYLRSVKDYQSLAYPPRLAVDLGSYVDCEAHEWARQPYGYFDPAPRPRDVTRTYFLRRRPRLAHPREGKSEVSLRGETLLPAPSLTWLMCLS